MCAGCAESACAHVLFGTECRLPVPADVHGAASIRAAEILLPGNPHARGGGKESHYEGPDEAHKVTDHSEDTRLVHCEKIFDTASS